jgi:hypothetical protein
VFRPDGKGGSELLARVKIDDWPALVGQQSASPSAFIAGRSFFDRS